MNTPLKVNSQEIGVIGKIIIPKDVENIIDYLHKSVGATEWSGILFYKLVGGNINELKDLQFQAQFIYPMNIGNAAYTEFDYNSEVMNAYDLNEELISCGTGLSHSHHSMSCFFSKDDTEELLENCKHFNYYISLIVNFSKDYKCKIAFPSKTKTTRECLIKNSEGQLVKATSSVEEDNIIVGELKIEFENVTSPEEWLINRTAELKKKKEEAAKVKLIVYNATQPSLPQRYNSWDNPNYSNYQDLSDNWDFPVMKIVTPKQFVQALLAMDEEFKDYPITKTLTDFVNEGIDADVFDTVMTANFDAIHDALYPTSKTLIMSHCKAALEELKKCEHLFTNYEGFYDVLKLNLETYAI